MNEINKALEALKKIADPIGYFQSQLAPGEQLNGVAAVQLSNDPAWLKTVAREAVAELTEPAAASERRSFEQLAAEFDPWWERSGQFCRAGGGGYEKTFAFYAWHAALEMAGVKLPAAGQCGESCERAKLCGACARGLDVVPEPAASEREAFEAWALDQWGDRPVPNNAWLGWQGRAAIAASHPAPPESDVKDAARYRWLRRGGTSKLDSEREEMVKSYGDHYLDEAIDAAMSASNQNGGE